MASTVPDLHSLKLLIWEDVAELKNHRNSKKRADDETRTEAIRCKNQTWSCLPCSHFGLSEPRFWGAAPGLANGFIADHPTLPVTSLAGRLRWKATYIPAVSRDVLAAVLRSRE